MDLSWWIELLWLLIMDLNPSFALFSKKRGRCRNQHRKSVPRHIRHYLLSKNKVPIYAYASKLNIFKSYQLKGWHASIFGGQIFDKDSVDYVGVMEKVPGTFILCFQFHMSMLQKDSQYPPTH